MVNILNLFDPWKSPLCTCPTKYSLSPYTGCQHECLYCYAQSYIPNFHLCRPKKKFISRLQRELLKANKELPISMSNSSDPYPPMEKEVLLTRKTLRLLNQHHMRTLIITKSDLITRDLDLLLEGKYAISITITTLEHEIAKKIEPNAPSPLKRLKALEKSIQKGISCSIRLDPIIPGINDQPDIIKRIIEKAASIGVKHIIASTYKARTIDLNKLINAFPKNRGKLWKLYMEMGERKGRSRYLPKKMRYKILMQVYKYASKHGLTFATCREGFPSLNRAPSCDGTHLIPK